SRSGKRGKGEQQPKPAARQHEQFPPRAAIQEAESWKPGVRADAQPVQLISHGGSKSAVGADRTVAPRESQLLGTNSTCRGHGLARFIALLVKIRKFLCNRAGPEEAGEGWAAGFGWRLS